MKSELSERIALEIKDLGSNVIVTNLLCDFQQEFLPPLCFSTKKTYLTAMAYIKICHDFVMQAFLQMEVYERSLTWSV